MARRSPEAGQSNPISNIGFARSFDRDVTTVIYELVNEKYFSKDLWVPEVMPIGTLRDFAERMGITVAGSTTAAIKESLKRLMHTLTACEETFFDNKQRRYISLSFRLLAGVGFAGEDDGNGGRYEENFVIFDQHILRNLNTGYVMVIDVEALRRLKSNIAKQLRGHLDHRFFIAEEDGHDYWVADYEWLAIHLGIKPQLELWRAKQQLQEAHEELKATDYIGDYRWDGWRVIYRPGAAWKGEQMRRQSGKKHHQSHSTIKSEQQQVLVINGLPNPEDERNAVLARQAARILAGGTPDESVLSANGLSVDDARRKAADFKQRSHPTKKV